MSPLPGLVGIAQAPQGTGFIGEALLPGGNPVADGEDTVSLGVGKPRTPRQKRTSLGELTQEVQGGPQRGASGQQEGMVVPRPGQREKFFPPALVPSETIPVCYKTASVHTIHGRAAGYPSLACTTRVLGLIFVPHFGDEAKPLVAINARPRISCNSSSCWGLC